MVGRVFGGGHFFFNLGFFLMGEGELVLLVFSGGLGFEVLGCFGEGERGREGGKDGELETGRIDRRMVPGD